MQFQPVYRITVFVPPENLRALINGIKSIHPLGDEHYDGVLWYAADAREEFRPLPGSNPARGNIGELHNGPVRELQFSLPRDEALLDRVVQEGIVAHHPWEAPGMFIEEAWMPLYIR